MLSNLDSIPRVAIAGLPFHSMSNAEFIDYLPQTIEAQSRVFLSTPNLNFLIAAQGDAAFRDSVVFSDVSIPDGMPIVWIARLLGLPLLERVAGSSTFEALRRGQGGLGRPWRVYFFGGPPGVAKKAAEVLNADGQHMVCVGFHSPGFGSINEMSSPELIAEINASGADFLVVALGAKKGQAWIQHNWPQLSVPIVSHLGAVVNFVAGSVQRAPLFWQSLNLEWLWRIKEEPALWRRYAVDALGLARLLMTQLLPAAWHERLARPEVSRFENATVTLETYSRHSTVFLSGAWGRDNLGRLREALSQAFSCEQFRIDLGQVCYLDSLAIGELLRLKQLLSRQGKDFRLLSLSLAVRRCLPWYGLAHWLE